MKELLRRRYTAPEWAFFEEVRNQTGVPSGKQDRYADAVAVNLWPSRGLEVLGFEVKVRRGDWLKELKSPAKSADIQQYCDRWWVVAGGRNIVHPGELPTTWGLLVVHGNGDKRRLVCTQEAPKLEPQEPDKAFLMALLRRASEAAERAQKGDGSTHFQKGWDAALEARDSRKSAELERVQYRLEKLEKAITKFEVASGVKLDRPWNYENIGTAVRAVLKNLRNPNGHRQALKDAMVPLRACLGAMQALDRTFSLLEEDGMGRKG